MFGLAIILSLLVILVLLWPRYDGGGIHYNYALMCAPCSAVGFAIMGALWIAVWWTA